MALNYVDKFSVSGDEWVDKQLGINIKNGDVTVKGSLCAYRSRWRKIIPSNNIPLSNNFANSDGYSKLSVPNDRLITIYYRLWCLYLIEYPDYKTNLPSLMNKFYINGGIYTKGTDENNKYSLFMFNPLTAIPNPDFNFKIGNYDFLNTNLSSYYDSSLTYDSYSSYDNSYYNEKTYYAVPRKITHDNAQSGTLIESECSGGPIAKSLKYNLNNENPICEAEFNLFIGDNQGYELGMPNISFLYSSMNGYENFDNVAMEVIYTLSDKVVS